MKVPIDAIDPQYRLQGRLYRALLRLRSPRALRFVSGPSHAAMGMRPSKVLACKKIVITKDDGQTLALYVFMPKHPVKDVPGVLWLHGGGYALGHAKSALYYAEKLAAASDCVIVAPDYALSARKPYPAALVDAYAALRWMQQNAASLGIGSSQLFIGGDSAGGGLAIATTLLARAQGEVRIAFQMPLYPMLDDRMQTSSMQGNDAPVWNEESNRAAWQLYLRDLYGTDKVTAFAAPARETDHTGLPPAFSFVGALDPFLDEDVAYFDALRASGVPAQMHVYDGCYHAFDQMSTKADKSRDATEKLQAAFTDAVHRYFAPQP